MSRWLAMLAVALATGASPAAAAAVSGGTLEVKGDAGQTAALSLADLAALPHETVSASAGHDGPAHVYEGARLTDVLRTVGAPLGPRLHGGPVMDVLIVTGADGYRAVLSLAEADPATHPPAKIIVADRVDGHALDPKEGPLRLVIDGDLRPMRSVHNLSSVEIRRLP